MDDKESELNDRTNEIRSLILAKYKFMVDEIRFVN